MLQRLCTAVFIAATLSAGCTKTTWVDFPMAECANLPDFKTNENVQFVARTICSNAGKSYAGSARCEKNAVQIGCK